jgi:hypothetical protein
VKPGAAALLLLGLGPAGAASSLEPPDLAQYVRWGPVRARPGIEFSNIGYNDNILYDQAGEAISDYTATVSPKLDGLVLFGDRAFLTFLEQFDYTLYLENGDQNYWNNRTQARLTVPFSNFGIFTDLTLADVKWRPTDLESIRPEERKRQFELGAIVEPDWRTRIEIARSVTDLSHSQQDSAEDVPSVALRLDRNEAASRVDVAYRAAGSTEILLEGLFKDIEFDFEPLVDGVPVDRDTRERRIMTGLEFGEGGPITGTIRVGWDRIDTADPLLSDLREVVAELELAYQLTSRTRLRFSGERLPGFAVWDVNTFYLNSEYGLRFVHYLNRTFGVEAGASRGRLTFPESTGDTDREDRLDRWDVGFRVRGFRNAMGRAVEYRLRIGRYRRTSTIPDFDHSQTTFGINAVLGFQ